MDALPGTQFTDMWLQNPWMTQPDQMSNRFSTFNNAPYAWPPTFDEGNMGGPVNAATGQPIQSYHTAMDAANADYQAKLAAWKQQNPAGVTINNTPAQPQQDPFGAMGAQLAGWQALSAPEQFQRGNRYGDPYLDMVAAAYQQPQQQQQQRGPEPKPPNNWQAALHAMAAPGNPVTPGANVPLSQSFQPAGGVNQAFLNQAGGGNPSFLGALAAIQGRPKSTFG